MGHHEYPRIHKHHINKIHRHHPGPVFFPWRPVGMAPMAPVPPAKGGGRIRGRRANKVKTGRRAKSNLFSLTSLTLRLEQAMAAPPGPGINPAALGMLLPLAALGIGGFFLGRLLRKSRTTLPRAHLGTGATITGPCVPTVGVSPLRTAVTTAPIAPIASATSTFVSAPPPTAAVPGIAPLSSVTGRVRPTLRERMGATGTVTRPGLTNRLRMLKNKVLYGTPFMIKEPVIPMGSTYRGLY